MTAAKTYALDDLMLGMEVSAAQLKNVYDTHIVLIDSRVIENDICGKIGFIGKELNNESDKLNRPDTVVADIYNSKSDAEDDVTYDE